MIRIRCEVSIFRLGPVSFLQLYVQARCPSLVSLYCFLFDLTIVSVCHTMRGEFLWFTNLLGDGVVKWKFSLLGNN